MAFGEWASVGRSSHVDAMRFDTESGTFEVRFNNGAVYQWIGIQEDTAIGITAASSPGRYLNSNVIGLYGPGTKV